MAADAINAGRANGSVTKRSRAHRRHPRSRPSRRMPLLGWRASRPRRRLRMPIPSRRIRHHRDPPPPPTICGQPPSVMPRMRGSIPESASNNAIAAAPIRCGTVTVSPAATNAVRRPDSAVSAAGARSPRPAPSRPTAIDSVSSHRAPEVTRPERSTRRPIVRGSRPTASDPGSATRRFRDRRRRPGDQHDGGEDRRRASDQLLVDALTDRRARFDANPRRAG